MMDDSVFREARFKKKYVPSGASRWLGVGGRAVTELDGGDWTGLGRNADTWTAFGVDGGAWTGFDRDAGASTSF
jgi:hypothetical protein